MIEVYPNEKSMRLLEQYAKETGRSTEDLATCAVDEYCLQAICRPNLLKIKELG